MFIGKEFRSETSDNMDSRWQESARRRGEVRRSEKRKSEMKEDAGARKGRKIMIHKVLPMICFFGGSKNRLAKGNFCKSRCFKGV